MTPNMLRLTLGGEGLAGFPDDQDGAYIKLHVPLADPAEDEFVIRTYTVRYYRAATGEMDVDFVMHDVEGPAALWAGNSRIGDQIRAGGSGPKKVANHGADWFLFAGDMSALPAISVNLESLPRDAVGVALLEIISEQDIQDIASPEGVAVEWLVNPHPDVKNSVLLDAVRRTQPGDGVPYFWVAGEFSQSLSIRAYLKSELSVTRDRMYASSYWQIGQSEDGHRVSKAGVRDD